jgi:hypothetical protein
MAFTRWVRSVSQQQLMVAAQTAMAARAGLATRPPKGQDTFWQKVYAPVFHRLPHRLRDKVVAAMPGSHRRTWHTPAQVSGPAASLFGPWSAKGTQAVPGRESSTGSQSGGE